MGPEASKHYGATFAQSAHFLPVDLGQSASVFLERQGTERGDERDCGDGWPVHTCWLAQGILPLSSDVGQQERETEIGGNDTKRKGIQAQ